MAKQLIEGDLTTYCGAFDAYDRFTRPEAPSYEALQSQFPRLFETFDAEQLADRGLDFAVAKLIEGGATDAELEQVVRAIFPEADMGVSQGVLRARHQIQGTADWLDEDDED